MDNAAIGDLFAGLGPVSIRRLFGGKGIYHDGVIFAISVGFSMNRKGPVSWQPLQYFIQGQTVKLGFFGTFRYLSYRVQCFHEGVNWKLIGFDLDLEPTASL